MEVLLLIIALLLAAILITLLGAWGTIGGVVISLGYILFVLALYGFAIYIIFKAFLATIEFVRHRRYLVVGYTAFCLFLSLLLAILNSPSGKISDAFGLWFLILFVLLPVLVLAIPIVDGLQKAFNSKHRAD